MNISIKSSGLTAELSSHGAELISLKDAEGREYIWQAEPSIWNRHAPILFPFICSTKDRRYRAGGREYQMAGNHGFARDSEFTPTKQSESEAVFTLAADENTLSCYPYDFLLTARYAFEGERLINEFTVKNRGTGDMYFYIGGHPGFNCPMGEGEDFSDYEILYNRPETIIQKIPGGERVILSEESALPLSHELFCHDVIMKDSPASDAITLRSKRSGRCVRLEFKYANCVAVWSPYSQNADFVCLEPWSSVPAYADDDYPDIENKPHAIRLPAGEEYIFSYVIEIGG